VLFSEPFRNEPQSEQWRLVIDRIQEMMLTAFSRLVSKFEDGMRAERERRTQPDWTFTKYFLLQVTDGKAAALDTCSPQCNQRAFFSHMAKLQE